MGHIYAKHGKPTPLVVKRTDKRGVEVESAGHSREVLMAEMKETGFPFHV